MKTRYTWIALAVIVVMLLGACGPQAAPTPQIVEVTKIVAGTPVQVVITATPAPVPTAAPTKAPAKKIVSWFQYDQGNVDPKSDERVGNQYMRDAIPVFNKEFDGKWVWENQFTPGIV